MTELDVRISDIPDYDRIKRGSTLTLPELRKLKLVVRAEPVRFMDNLTLPSLDSSSITDQNDEWEDLDDVFAEFSQRSKAPPAFLELEGNVDEMALICSLRLLPTLQDFRIRYAFATRRFFDELAVRREDGNLVRSDSVLCPSLAHLLLDEAFIWRNADSCMKALVNMAKSRWEIFGMSRMIYCSDTRACCRNQWDVSDFDFELDVMSLVSCITYKMLDGDLALRSDDAPVHPFSDWREMTW